MGKGLIPCLFNMPISFFMAPFIVLLQSNCLLIREKKSNQTCCAFIL